MNGSNNAITTLSTKGEDGLKLTKTEQEIWDNTTDQLEQLGIISINKEDNTIGLTKKFKEECKKCYKEAHKNKPEEIQIFLSSFPDINEQERLELCYHYAGYEALIKLVGSVMDKKEFDMCAKLIDGLMEMDFKVKSSKSTSQSNSSVVIKE